jgi:hypothetical protein
VPVGLPPAVAGFAVKLPAGWGGQTSAMGGLLRSILTASLLSAALVALGVEGVAPHLPPYVGAADAKDTRAFSLPGRPRIEVMATDGSIRIATHEDPANTTCEISAEIRLYNTSANEYVINPPMQIARVVSAEADDDVIRVRSLPDDWPAELAAIVKYTITVPRGTDVDVRGANGNVWVAEGCGKISIESVNADVEVRGPEGPVMARSTNGRLRLYGGQGPSVLETVNGNIRADMLGGSLTASSVNGRVQTEVLAPEVLACALRSENGDVTVAINGTIGFTLDATAARGDVRGDTGLPLDPQTPGVFRAREGSGDTRLTLATSNGSIRITRR